MSRTELLEKIRQYKELTIFIKELSEESDSIKSEITAQMDADNTDTMTVDIFTVKWTAYQSSRVDTTALKKELPQIAERFTKTSEARRFAIV